MAISVAGVGSGLDVNGIITQLMGLERQPLLQLDRKEAEFQAQLSAFGALKGSLSSFQTTVRGLSSLSKFQTHKATSADTTIYTANASSSAVAGSYAIEVVKLAQAHKINTAAQTSQTTAIGSGGGTTTLTFDFGTISGGTLSNGVYTGASFTLNSNKSSKTVTVNNTSTLQGIRDAVNAANIGVTAAIINDGGATPYRLVLTSNDTGAANSLRIAVSGDAAISGLLAYNPAGTQNPTQLVAAQDAQIKVDGLTVNKSSNTITDVVQGVTLNLLKQSASGVTTSLSVARDTDAVKSSINAFVKAYNDLNKTVQDLTAYNAATKQGSILQGDSGALAVIRQVRTTLNNTVKFINGNYSLLSQIGVSFQKDGTLSVDAAKLQAAIDANFNDIAGLFAALGKPTDNQITYVSATDKTAPGNYTVTVSQLATQGNAKGSVAPNLTITAGGNDSLGVTVDGVAATVTLAPATYGSYAALAAEVQAKLNGASALSAAGIAVTVTVEAGTNKLIITSNRYGSPSTVTGFTGNAIADLLGTPTSTAGVDVAGTINGVAATGSGQNLTGATGNATEGLKLQVIGGATGSRGTVNYSQGYAYQLDKLADNLLASSGPVASRTDGINRSIKDISTQRETLNRRLAEVEKRLRAQFTALDKVVSQLKSTSDFLTKQLSRLPNVTG
ncbi:MAG: flagellar filament capping protein FliD [Pseudomonadota bacterium]